MYGGQGCGSGCALEKTFTNLPPHSEVFVEVYVVTLDSWDQDGSYGRDHVAVEIDGTTHGKFYAGSLNPANQGSGVCAIYGHRDSGPYVCVAYAPHVNSSITIKVRANVSEDSGGYSDEYLGIVAAKLYLR